MGAGERAYRTRWVLNFQHWCGLQMPLDTDKELDAHFLSSLGKNFEARLADQVGNVTAELAAYKSGLEQLQQELNQERTGHADLKRANAEADVRLIVAQAQEGLVQNIARIEERALLALRFSEQSTAAKAEVAIELRHVREAAAETRVEVRNIGAEHAKLAGRVAAIGQQTSAALDGIERASAKILEVRTDMPGAISARIAEVLHRVEDVAQAAATEIARLEAARLEALTTGALTLRDKEFARLDERMTNVLRAMGQASCTAAELRTDLVGERDRIRDEMAGFKAQLLSDVAQARASLEEQVLAAVEKAHARAADLEQTSLEERSAVAAGRFEDEHRDALESCLGWLVNHGETALTETSGAFDFTSALSWSDEIFVDCAYRWLLDRPAESAGLDYHVDRLRCGTSRRRLLIDIARSDEATARLRYCFAFESDDRAFLYSAYTLLLGRGLDGGGQEHYLGALARKGERARGDILRDIAYSQEARLNRTMQASAWRFVAGAGTRAVRWREWWLRVRPGGRASNRHAWQVGRLMLDAGMHRARPRAQGGMGKDRQDLVGAVHGHIAQVPGAGSIPASSNKKAPPTPGAQAAGVPGLGSKLPLKVLLGDTASERSVASIAQAIRAELQELGLN